MEKEPIKLYLNDMSQLSMYKIFGLRKVLKLQELEDWTSSLPVLNTVEQTIAKHYQLELIDNIDAWNEQELSLNFIGPIFTSIRFTVLHRLKWFAQRPLSEIIGEYQLIGKPDGIIASGYFEPETPYFSFQEFKKDIDSSGDPIGQNLAAMLIGQAKNGDNKPIYGCCVVGRNWYFMVLKGKEYALSKSYSADDEEDIFKIIQVLKALRNILFKKLGLVKNE